MPLYHLFVVVSKYLLKTNDILNEKGKYTFFLHAVDDKFNRLIQIFSVIKFGLAAP